MNLNQDYLNDIYQNELEDIIKYLLRHSSLCSGESYLPLDDSTLLN